MILDDFDRATLDMIRTRILDTPGASKREARIAFARELELIERLYVAPIIGASAAELRDLVSAAFAVRERKLSVKAHTDYNDRAACDLLNAAVDALR